MRAVAVFSTTILGLLLGTTAPANAQHGQGHETGYDRPHGNVKQKHAYNSRSEHGRHEAAELSNVISTTRVDHMKPFSEVPSVSSSIGSLLPGTSARRGPANPNHHGSIGETFGKASAHSIGKVSIVFGGNVVATTATGSPKIASGRTLVVGIAFTSMKSPLWWWKDIRVSSSEDSGSAWLILGRSRGRPLGTELMRCTSIT